MKLAETMGAKTYLVTRKEDLKPVLEEVTGLNISVAAECQIQCDDEVFPIVSPGAPIQDVFGDAGLKI